MAISGATANGILAVVRRHVTKKQAEAILQDLLHVPGNGSYRESVKRLLAQVKKKEP